MSLEKFKAWREKQRESELDRKRQRVKRLDRQIKRLEKKEVVKPVVSNGEKFFKHFYFK